VDPIKEMTPLRKNRIILVRGKEPILFDPDHGFVYKINDTAAAIYKKCDGKHSVEMINTELSEEFAGHPKAMRRDLERILKYMETQGLISWLPDRKRSTLHRKSNS
jgi:hypothetical protein